MLRKTNEFILKRNFTVVKHRKPISRAIRRSFQNENPMEQRFSAQILAGIWGGQEARPQIRSLCPKEVWTWGLAPG